MSKTRREILKAFAVAGGTAGTIGSLGSASRMAEIEHASWTSGVSRGDRTADCARLFFRDARGRPLAIAETRLEVMPAARGEIGVQLQPFRAIAFNTGTVVDVALVRGDVLVGALAAGETDATDVTMSSTSVVDGDVITFGSPLTISASFGSAGMLEA